MDFVKKITSHESLRTGCDLPVRRASRRTALYVLARVAGPAKPNAQKQEAYECGVEPTSAVSGRFPVRFYLIAMLFVIFDVEAASFYPWAVQMHALRIFGLLEMVVVRHRAGDRLRVRMEEGRVCVEIGLRANFLLARLDDVARWAQSSSRVAADDGPRVLRDRDDDRDGGRVRHRALRFRSVSHVAAPGRSDDRLRPRRAEDGAGRASGSTIRWPIRNG